MKRLEIAMNGIVASAEIFEDKAPITVAALEKVLPIVDDRTIPTQWSGQAWRTERDYELVPYDANVEAENLADRLSAGDVIFYPRVKKIGIAYGQAKWLGPYYLERQVTLLGKVDTNLDAFLETSLQIIYHGPYVVTLTATS